MGREPLLPENGLGGRQARDGQAIRRAGHVVETQFVAQHDRTWIAAVLTANADLDIRPRLATRGDREAHELAHAVPIQADERTTS